MRTDLPIVTRNFYKHLGGEYCTYNELLEEWHELKNVLTREEQLLPHYKIHILALSETISHMTRERELQQERRRHENS